MTDWHPIETAPKDGTRIDLWVDYDRLSDCRWVGDDWSDPTFAEIDFVTGSKNGGRLTKHNLTPTHWMPLPDPPKEIDHG